MALPFWTAARRRFPLFPLCLSAVAWLEAAAPCVLVKDGRSAGYILVSGRAPLDQFAAREFTDIFLRSTGITLKTVFPGGDAAELPRKRIFIGDTPQARRYPEGDEHHVYEFWASLKFTGPAFDAQSGQTRNRAFCDRVFIVDQAGMDQEKK